MEDKLRRYVDGLFEEAAPTKKTVELKEEMIQNLHDKYNDLISDGKTPEAAYNIAVAGIGDVSGLLMELEAEVTREERPDMYDINASRRKSAFLTAIAVMMYILSVLPMIIFWEFNSRYASRIGVPIMFVFIALATGIVIYNSMTKPKFRNGAGTMVDEFRKWQKGANDHRALRRAISSALWSILVALYFIISFASNAWHITWVIFILGAALEAIINIFTSLRK